MRISQIVKRAFFAAFFLSPISAFAGRMSVTNGSSQIQSSQIVGSVAGSAAPAGATGQIISSVTANAQSVGSSGQFANVVQLTLTPGTYIAWGSVHVVANSATVTVTQAAISVNSGNTTTDHVAGTNQLDGFLATAVINGAVDLAPYPINVSATTTIYLKLKATYITATPNVGGALYALRVY